MSTQKVFRLIVLVAAILVVLSVVFGVELVAASIWSYISDFIDAMEKFWLISSVVVWFLNDRNSGADSKKQ